jgi:hypothetical protein
MSKSFRMCYKDGIGTPHVTEHRGFTIVIGVEVAFDGGPMVSPRNYCLAVQEKLLTHVRHLEFQDGFPSDMDADCAAERWISAHLAAEKRQMEAAQP